MKMIVGLGNIGKEYEKTRHNIGFMAIDLLLKKLDLKLDLKKFKAEYTIDKKNNVMIVKPLTYMNLSGEAVLSLANYYKIKRENIIVVYDDLDLEVGKIRIRENGSSAGQKGIGNIISLFNSSEIKRIRIGIGKNKMIPVVDYVLQKISKEEEVIYSEVFEKVSNALIYYLNNDFKQTMNKFNV